MSGITSLNLDKTLRTFDDFRVLLYFRGLFRLQHDTLVVMASRLQRCHILIRMLLFHHCLSHIADIALFLFLLRPRFARRLHKRSIAGAGAGHLDRFASALADTRVVVDCLVVVDLLHALAALRQNLLVPRLVADGLARSREHVGLRLGAAVVKVSRSSVSVILELGDL